jgi:hypothetical protein
VTDFGLVCLVQTQEPTPRDDPSLGEKVTLPESSPGTDGPESTILTPLTSIGQVLGTPGYIAPEQYGIEAIDVRTDVFAFCASAYSALYGQRPFAGKTSEEIAHEVCKGNVRAVPADSDVPVRIRDVLLRGLTVDPADRPQSMEEVLAILHAGRAHGPQRWIALAAAVLGVSAVIGEVREAALLRTRACYAEAERLDGAWDAPRRRRIADAFKATGLSYAGSTWGKVEGTLNAYAAAWSHSAVQACLATRERNEASESAFGLRSACLDERLDHLQGLSEILASADAKTVDDAVKAAYELPPVAQCWDLDRLGSAVRLPPGPAARSEVRALQREIAAAKALLDTGKAPRALDRLRNIRDRVESAGFGQVRFLWRLRTAEAESEADPRGAADDYELALMQADAQRFDAERAEAAIHLANLDVQWLGRHEDGRWWLRLAEAAIERMGGDSRLEVMREIQQGWLDQKEGRATDLFDRALNREREAGLNNPILRGRAHYSAGWRLVRGREQERVRHARLAVADAREAYGLEHPVVAQYMANLAAAELDAGDLDVALASISNTLAMLDRMAVPGDAAAMSRDVARAEAVMGAVLVRFRRHSEAVEHLTRAHELIARATGLENCQALEIDNGLVEAYLRLSQVAEAAGVLEEARSIVRGARCEVGTGVMLAEHASLELKLRRPARALPLAERSLATLLEERSADTYELSYARLVTARVLALTGRDADRARDLAREARDGFLASNDPADVADASELITQMR